MEYEKIGLKAGIEIHQQLDTGRKLFCRCPGFLRSDKADVIVRRRLHPVAGESGEVDTAVQYEAMMKKEFVYEGYSDSNCLVEFDEEPPHFIDESALDEALKIALLLNCEIYPIAQVMRKTVIDGSNTSGFQRTVLVAHDGAVETSFGKVRIEGVFLEEDSARPVSDDGKRAVYRLDRLGIPLVEIVTSPDMKMPEQIKECALKIGEILRACKVKRGIGTIRQDLNISIKGHDKVEIKGFQELRIMLKTVELESERQLEESKKGKTSGEVRWALEDGKTEYARPMPGRARMYPETDLLLLRIRRERINKIKKELPKLKHEIRDELKKKGLSGELIELVLESKESLEEFEVLLSVYGEDVNLVGKMSALWPKEFASKDKKSVSEIKGVLTERVLERVLEKVKEGVFGEGSVKEILWDIVKGKPVEEALELKRAGEDELEEEIRKIVKEIPGLRENAYMGIAIKKLGSKLDKRKAMGILKKIVGE